MKKYVLICVMALCLPLVSGCAASVKYCLDKDVYRSDAPVNSRAVLYTFKDIRPDAEHSGTMDLPDIHMYTKDQNFSPDIDKQISRMLVAHLDKAGIFQKIEFRDMPDDASLEAAIRQLDQQGVDYVITGDIAHFYGYQSGSSGAAGSLFGALGVIAEAIANPKTVGGEAAYRNVKVVNVNNGATIDLGDVSYEFEDKVKMYETPVAYSLRALKGANNEFAKKLEESAGSAP